MEFIIRQNSPTKKLAIFDFDYTIINLNSTNYLNKLLIKHDLASSKTDQQLNSTRNFTPSTAQMNRYKFPPHIELLKATNPRNNTLKMQAVFQHMHSAYKLTRSDLTNCLNEIKISNPMKYLLQTLASHGYDLCIISDSNTFVIEQILISNGLLELFETKIFANKAQFNESSGYLEVTPVNELINENRACFNCDTGHCKENICKGVILEKLLSLNRVQGHVIYVGDGRIDFCPGLKLKSSDDFFVKKNLTLARMLLQTDKNAEAVVELRARLKADVTYWKNPQEILDKLKI